jgi:HEAT repeat protein
VPLSGEVTEVLFSKLDDFEDDEEFAAAEALQALAPWLPVESLKRHLSDLNWFPRQTAMEALAALGEACPVEILIAAAGNADGRIRGIALQALAALGEACPVELLVAAVGDTNGGVREIALEALHKSHPESLPPLVEEAVAVLQGQSVGPVLSSIVQHFVAVGIGEQRLTSPVALDYLVELLWWPYWPVRLEAEEALGKLRANLPEAAVRRLRELTRDPESSAVRAAARKLV